MSLSLTLEHVRAALALPDFDVDAAWRPMHLRPNPRPRFPPPDARTREAGVLVAVYPTGAGLTTLLIQRAPDPGVHSGQVAFPGGGREPEDSDPVATALREASEEVGLCRADVTVLGRLTQLYIPPSGYLVWPVVGALDARPVWRPDPRQVAGLLELPWRPCWTTGSNTSATGNWAGELPRAVLRRAGAGGVGRDGVDAQRISRPGCGRSRRCPDCPHDHGGFSRAVNSRTMIEVE
jgi:8-oxo-dGTP pyrophosphatase MutT (NUDIX family)